MNRLSVAAVSSVLVAAIGASGCLTLGPDYARPELALPESYSQASLPLAERPAEEWWTLFGDPALDALVAEALAANQDLAAAVARVDEARALAGLARADRLPAISAGVSGSRDKFSAETAQFPPDFPLEMETYRATLDLSFELDFWGRLARLSEAARAELLASEEGRRNVRLAVAAETASAWFDLLALERELALADATLVSRRESVRLQRLRFDAGSISELDLAQAEAELAATEAAVPPRQRALRQTENRLAVLLGRIGGGFAELPRRGGLEAARAPDVPVGLPSELLARRPDIAAAEQRLVAANARIGVARSGYFPSISLTGSTGSESAELSGLFRSGTGVWGIAAGLLQGVFQGGRVMRNVEAAEARQRQMLAGYAKAVQSAFAEVEDALVGRSTSVAEREALARQVEALTRSRRLAGLRYDGGDSSYFEVLDAERSLFRAELALVAARRAELGAAVTLFKALGGGWEAAAPAAP